MQISPIFCSFYSIDTAISNFPPPKKRCQHFRPELSCVTVTLFIVFVRFSLWHKRTFATVILRFECQHDWRGRVVWGWKLCEVFDDCFFVSGENWAAEKNLILAVKQHATRVADTWCVMCKYLYLYLISHFFLMILYFWIASIWATCLTFWPVCGCVNSLCAGQFHSNSTGKDVSGCNSVLNLLRL